VLTRKYISVKSSDSKLKERNKELSLLLDISNVLSASLNLQQVLDGAITKVLEHFDYDACRIYLKKGEGEFLNLAACKGINPQGFEKVSMNESFSGKAVRTNSFIAQHVSELEDKQRAAFLSDQGFKVVVCVPLIFMDQVVGVMNLTTGKVIELNQNEIDLLIATGNQVAIAINNAMLYQEVERKVKEIKEKKETIKFFAFSASHDLKSPAVGLHGLARLFRKRYWDILDTKGREYCDQILKAAGHIEDLVEKINHYIKAREAPLNIEKINIKENIGVVRNEFSDILENRRIKWVEPEAIPDITADSLSITRVFRNFVDNALKHGGEDLSEVRIGYCENSDDHIFFVSNDGGSIKTEDAESIFELFSRKNTAKGTEGAGMGLAIVKEIAERHGGRAWVECQPGERTTFYIAISKKNTSDEVPEEKKLSATKFMNSKPTIEGTG